MRRSSVPDFGVAQNDAVATVQFKQPFAAELEFDGSAVTCRKTTSSQHDGVEDIGSQRTKIDNNESEAVQRIFGRRTFF